MTDTAERIVKLAGRLDPEPPFVGECAAAWFDWEQRVRDRDDVLAPATPGAELGALVDLFDFALPDHFMSIVMDGDGNGYQAAIAKDATSLVWRTGPTAAAALLAAMEGI